MKEPLTLSRIAELIDGRILQGDPTAEFTGLNALKDASANDVSFFGNAKYQKDFEASAAGAILVGLETDSSQVGMALIEVENPTWAFQKVVDHFIERAPAPTAGISPAATVDESAEVDATAVILAGARIEAGAKVGAGCFIGTNSVVGPLAVVGVDCHIRSGVVIEERCVLGDRVSVQSGAVIGSDGFGYEFIDGALQKIDQVGIVQVDDDVEIGANTTIDRARFGKTHIGRGTKIDNLVQIGHNVVVGQNSIIIAQTGIAGSTTIGNYVTIAAQSGVAGHLKVGDQVTLAGRTGVIKNLPDKGVYSGYPARPMREEQRTAARVQRLDKLIARVKALEDQLEGDAK